MFIQATAIRRNFYFKRRVSLHLHPTPISTKLEPVLTLKTSFLPPCVRGRSCCGCGEFRPLSNFFVHHKSQRISQRNVIPNEIVFVKMFCWFKVSRYLFLSPLRVVPSFSGGKSEQVGESNCLHLSAVISLLTLVVTSKP